MPNLNLQKFREWVWPWPWTFNNIDVTAWCHKWNHGECCTIVAIQLHNSFGFQL